MSKSNVPKMFSKWTFLLFILLLVLCKSRMLSDDGSGGWDDSDITDASKLVQRNKTNLVMGLFDNITRNTSDFHYVARDDHEVIHNLQLEMRKKSRKRGTKHCWVSCITYFRLVRSVNNILTSALYIN